MRARPRVALPGCSNGPHAARYVPRPASRSRRFVTGDDHVNWLFLISVPPRYCVVSGDVVDVRPPRPMAPTTALDVGCVRQPSPVEENVAPLHGILKSWWYVNLLRGVICVVSRMLAIWKLSAPCAERVVSGE